MTGSGEEQSMEQLLHRLYDIQLQLERALRGQVTADRAGALKQAIGNVKSAQTWLRKVEDTR